MYILILKNIFYVKKHIKGNLLDVDINCMVSKLNNFAYYSILLFARFINMIEYHFSPI